jgi:heme/copper-type cytochrome/quinol oxidase subunit 2
MLDVMNAWDRYQHLQYWWMHMMTFIWIVFTVVLFVLEPLILHRWFRDQATKDSENAFTWLHRLHEVLLALSMLAILGAVAGAHGFQF